MGTQFPRANAYIRVMQKSHWKNGIRNGPSREGLLDTCGVHDPGALAAIGEDQVWREVCIDLQHPQVCLVGVDRSNR